MDARRLVRGVTRRLTHPMGGKVNAFGRGTIGLIDVGSIGWMPEPWYSGAATVRRTLRFEPQKVGSAKRDVVTVDAALWSQPERRDFYIYQGRQGASLYPQNYDYVRDNFESLRRHGPKRLAETWFERSKLTRTESIECTTLDAVVADNPGPWHFLKVDTQGAELPILRGARGYLDSGECLAMQLELFRIPLYEGIALRDEVTAWLADVGYDEAKVLPPHGTFDSQNDVIFVRRGAKGAVFEDIRAVCKF